VNARLEWVEMMREKHQGWSKRIGEVVRTGVDCGDDADREKFDGERDLNRGIRKGSDERYPISGNIDAKTSLANVNKTSQTTLDIPQHHQHSTTTVLPASICSPSSQPSQPPSPTPKNNPFTSFLTHILKLQVLDELYFLQKSLIRTVEIFISYMLMLLVMSFNVWVILAALLGVFIGGWVFERDEDERLGGGVVKRHERDSDEKAGRESHGRMVGARRSKSGVDGTSCLH
jgi:hypothetical protein